MRGSEGRFATLVFTSLFMSIAAEMNIGTNWKDNFGVGCEGELLCSMLSLHTCVTVCCGWLF